LKKGQNNAQKSQKREQIRWFFMLKLKKQSQFAGMTNRLKVNKANLPV